MGSDIRNSGEQQPSSLPDKNSSLSERDNQKENVPCPKGAFDLQNGDSSHRGSRRRISASNAGHRDAANSYSSDNCSEKGYLRDAEPFLESLDLETKAAPQQQPPQMQPSEHRQSLIRLTQQLQKNPKRPRCISRDSSKDIGMPYKSESSSENEKPPEEAAPSRIAPEQKKEAANRKLLHRISNHPDFQRYLQKRNTFIDMDRDMKINRTSHQGHLVKNSYSYNHAKKNPSRSISQSQSLTFSSPRPRKTTLVSELEEDAADVGKPPSYTIPMPAKINSEYELPTRVSIAPDTEAESDTTQVTNAGVSDSAKHNRLWLKQFYWVGAFCILILGIGFLFLIFYSNLTILNAPMFTWCLTITVALAAYLFAKLLVHFIVLLIERFFFLTENVVYYIMGVRTSLHWCIWSIITLLNWRFTMTYDYKKRAHTFDYRANDAIWIYHVLVSLLVTWIAILFKNIIVKHMANGYHQKAYFDRIQNALFAEYMISQLCKNPSSRFAQLATKKLSDEDGKKKKHDCDFRRDCSEEFPINEENLQEISEAKNVSFFQLNKCMSFVRDNSLGARSFAGSLSFIYADQSTENHSTPMQAKILAKRLFKKIRSPGEKLVAYDDFIPFFKRSTEVERTFQFFDVNGDGTVSRREMIEGIQNIYKERKALAYSLTDSKTIVETLNKVVTSVLFVILFFIYLFIFGVDVLQVVLSLTTILVGFAFAFGDSIKQIYESTIFIFVVHPFDVGDRIQLPEGGCYVTSINLQFTEFDRWDGQKIYYPNPVLLKIPIQNLNRSENMWDTLSFQVDNSVSNEKILAIQNGVARYLLEHSIDWHPEFDFLLQDIEKSNLLTFQILVQHRTNFQRMSARYVRRTHLYLFLKDLLEEIGVTYHPPIQKIQIHGDKQSLNLPELSV
eukprot:Sdes_comp18036_c0_seq1m7360